MDITAITLAQVLSTLRDAGVIGLLVMIILGGYKKWWVWGYLYEEAKKEADEWKEIALKGTELADRMVDISKKRRG